MYQHIGTIVQGLADQNGTRYTKEGILQHGGARKKGAVESKNWLHHSAKPVKEGKNIGIVCLCVPHYVESNSKGVDVTSVQSQDFDDSDNLCSSQENGASRDEFW